MEQKQLIENLNRLDEAFYQHSHCCRCGRQMPSDERYADKVCDDCKKPKQTGRPPF